MIGCLVYRRHQAQQYVRSTTSLEVSAITAPILQAPGEPLCKVTQVRGS